MIHFLSTDKNQIHCSFNFIIFPLYNSSFLYKSTVIGNDKYNKIEMFPVNNEWLNCLSSYQYGSISLLNEKKTFGISCNYDFNIYIVQHEKISLLNNAFWEALSKINCSNQQYTDGIHKSRKISFLDRKHVSMTEE